MVEQADPNSALRRPGAEPELVKLRREYVERFGTTYLPGFAQVDTAAKSGKGAGRNELQPPRLPSLKLLAAVFGCSEKPAGAVLRAAEKLALEREQKVGDEVARPLLEGEDMRQPAVWEGVEMPRVTSADKRAHIAHMAITGRIDRFEARIADEILKLHEKLDRLLALMEEGLEEGDFALVAGLHAEIGAYGLNRYEELARFDLDEAA
jgi:hypothetical protein